MKPINIIILITVLTFSFFSCSNNTQSKESENETNYKSPDFEVNIENIEKYFSDIKIILPEKRNMVLIFSDKVCPDCLTHVETLIKSYPELISTIILNSKDADKSWIISKLCSYADSTKTQIINDRENKFAEKIYNGHMPVIIFTKDSKVISYTEYTFANYQEILDLIEKKKAI